MNQHRLSRSEEPSVKIELDINKDKTNDTVVGRQNNTGLCPSLRTSQYIATQ